MLFCVVERLVLEPKLLDCLAFSFSLVEEIEMDVVFIVVLFVVIGVVCLLVVEDGLLKTVKGVTLGLCVVILCLVNVGFDIAVLGLLLSKLLGRIFVLVKLKFLSLIVGLLLLTFCPNTIVAVALLGGI